MKTIKTLRITITMLMLFVSNLMLHAQEVTPAADVNLFCSGTDLDLGAPPTNEEWVVLYSEEPTPTPNTGKILLGNSIPAADLETGYYYIATKGNDSNPQICISEMEVVKVYVFKPIIASITAEDYCIEDAGNQSFEADLSLTIDPYTTFAYQWYTFDGTTETAIPSATNSTYTPDPSIAAETTTTYRLKVGYLVNGLAYCSAVGQKDVTVLETPDKPTITIGGIAIGAPL